MFASSINAATADGANYEQFIKRHSRTHASPQHSPGDLNMTNSALFDRVRVGDLELPNRIVMAPLTRNRAHPNGDVPHALNAEYYAQRASAGLIISEASQVSPEGKGYAWTPGIYSDAQVEGWRQVTDAVHAKGGRMFIQLWHVGRVSHTSLQPNERAPVAPSALAAEAQTFDGKSFLFRTWIFNFIPHRSHY